MQDGKKSCGNKELMEIRLYMADTNGVVTQVDANGALTAAETANGALTAAETSGSLTGVFLTIVILGIVVTVLYLWWRSRTASDGNKQLSDVSSSRNKGGKVAATDKERAFLELIHLLAEASNKTDKKYPKD